jgi:hypothetical protein
MTPATMTRGVLPLAVAATVACAALGGCVDGTTADCSANPSPCGYPQPSTAMGDDAGDADGGGGG